tara:strand:- start:297 stop:599 length:303 start_codon:yes stop_codon:yes gene_type:complete
MTIYRIKDADGNVTNAGIQADETFMAANFDHYEAFVSEEIPAVTDEQEARMWRDDELRGTDYTVPLTDHPQHSAYITYRAALRAWPSTSDFPTTKPELGE